MECGLVNFISIFTESKDHQIKLDTIPIITRPRDSYTLNVTDTDNNNTATITNVNTQNIINPEIFIDDDFCKLIHILQQYKSQYQANEVKLEVGYGERKREIDLREKSGGKVKWFSQFDNTKEGMGAKAGNTACKLTCDEILRRSGVSSSETPTSYRGKILYQISIEKDVMYYQSNDTHKRIPDGDLNEKEQNKYLDYDEKILQESLKYIDTELGKGYPIAIGVDHTYQHKGGFNNDLSTDHFIVIVGRKYDEKENINGEQATTIGYTYNLILC